MSILSVKEINAGRRLGFDERGLRVYYREWRLITDDAKHGQLDVLAALPVRRYDYYQDKSGTADKAALALELDAQIEDPENPFQWIATVRYSTEIWESIARNLASGGASSALGSPPTKPPGSGGGSDAAGDSPENPLLHPALISYGQTKIQKVLEKDKSTPAKVVANSAGERFDPPYMTDVVLLTLTIERNEASFPQAALNFEYQNKVNKELWWGGNPRYWRCESITGNSQWQNGFYFWKVRYEFWFHPDTWDIAALDQGFRTKDGSNKTAAILGDLDGLAVHQPHLLNGSGLKLAAGGQPVYLPFQPYDEADFNKLELP